MKICTEILPPSKVQEFAERKGVNRAAFLKDNLWETGDTIKIYMYESPSYVPRTPLQTLETLGNLDPLEYEIRNLSPEDAVRKVVQERVNPLVNLNLVFTNNKNESDIRISWEEGGAYSLVGNQHRLSNKDSTMNLGWLDLGTIEHEFGHALGMIHEHSNPRGEQIQWNKPLAYKYFGGPPNMWTPAEVDLQVFERYDVENINGSDFDPNSVMLYFFPAKITLNNKGTKANPKYSELDKKWLMKMYPGGKGIPSQKDRSDRKKNMTTYLYIGVGVLLLILLLVLVL